MNKYIKNYILSISNNVLLLLFPIITFPYVSRILGSSNLGEINFVQSYGYYFMQIANFGISSYAIREVSRVRDDEEKVSKISNEIFNLNLFFSIISAVFYFIGVLSVPQLRENILLFTIYSVVIFSNFLSLDWLLQSFDDYMFSTIRNIFIRIVSIIAVFCFVKKQEDYIIYLIINCFSEMGTKFSTLFYSRKHYVRLNLKVKYLNFAAHIKTMFTLFTFRLVNSISSNLDKLMIGFMMIYSSVGVYSAGVKFILMFNPLVEAAGTVLFPKINISAGSSTKEYLNNLKINYDIILFMAIPMVVGMILVSERVIMLFSGIQYAGAVSVSRIMSITILLGPIGDLLGSKILLVYKKDRHLLMSSAMVALSNIIFNFIFIPIWGINGAAIASVISYLVSVLSRLYFARKIVKFNLFTRSLLKYSLFTVPFIIIYIFFRSFIDNINICMFLFVAVCGIIYMAELLLSKDNLTKMILENTLKRRKV